MLLFFSFLPKGYFSRLIKLGITSIFVSILNNSSVSFFKLSDTAVTASDLLILNSTAALYDG